MLKNPAANTGTAHNSALKATPAGLTRPRLQTHAVLSELRKWIRPVSCLMMVLGLGSQARAATNDLRITSIFPQNGKIIVRWQGGTGPYQLLCTTNLQEGWRKVGSPTSGFSATNSAPAAAACLFLVTTDITAPSTPGGLQVNTNGCGQLALKWNTASDNANGAGVRGYRIYRNGVFYKEVPASTNYIDGGLPALTTYSYRLSAIDGAGNESGQATAVSATTLNCTNASPTANAGPDVTNKVGVPVSLSGASSRDSDGSIVAYSWNFGDGTTATGTNVSHVYSNAGTFTAALTVTDNKGAAATDLVVVSVTNTPNQLPVANAGPDKTALKGTTVSFSAAGSSDPDGTITSYAWNFGDGGSATGTNVSRVYTNSGNYTVTLTVTDNKGATASDTALVTITNAANQLPVANAGPDKSGGVGVAVSFQGYGSDADGTINAYLWTFGDGGTATTANPSHVYTNAGTYVATLKVTDNAGAVATDSASVTITNIPNVPPVANAGPDKAAQKGAVVSFSGAGSSDSDGTIVSYAWNFGDGSSATGTNVSRAFTNIGTFTVTLTVTDNRGATKADSALVTITNAPNQLPMANAGPDKAALKGTTVSFSSTGSSDPDGTIATYAWNFGDGGSAAGATVSRVYTNAGTYTVTLTVTDNSGATATDSAVVTITNLPNQRPVANAGPDKSALKGTTVSFSSTGSSDPDGSIAQYAWTFGDGGSAIGASASRVYTNAGTYTVTLTVTDNSGATAADTAIVTITNNVNQPPRANAGADQSATASSTVSFGGAGSADPDGSIVSYQWNFGDGTSGTGVNVAHAYVAAGTYTVTLTVTDNNGATATDTALVTIAAAAEMGRLLNVANYGSSQIDVGQAAAQDKFGNVFLGGGLYSHPFLAKHGPSGSTVWSFMVDGPGTGSIRALATDADGNVYLTGNILGTLYFGSSPISSVGGSDIFIAKFTGNGTHVWSKRFGSTKANAAVDESGCSIVVDTNSNTIVVTGNFDEVVDFGGGPLVSTSGQDLFLVKFTTSGNYVWSKRIGGSAGTIGTAVALDRSNNIVLGGNFSSTVDFGKGAVANRGSMDVFIAKYNSNGLCLWVKTFGTNSPWPSTASISAIAVDSQDNVVVTGSYQLEMSFGGAVLPYGGYGDLFLAKYSGQDGAHLWSKGFGGAGIDQGNGVAIGKNDDIYLTGRPGSALNFGSGTMDYTSAQMNMFVADFRADGTCRWSKAYVLGIGEAKGIAVDAAANVHVVGNYTAASFEGAIPPNAGLRDLFVLKFAP